MNKKWIDQFFHHAMLSASMSKDPRTKVGAVAVGDAKQIIATGFNGLPRGVEDFAARMLPPQKYDWTIHAEANVVAHAARHVLKGATVFVTHCACSQCMGLLINAGVAKVVFGDGKTSMPIEKFEIGLQMCKEADIEVDFPYGDPFEPPR